MSVDFSVINQACLSAFGQAFTFTPAATGEAQSVSGILDSGVQPENVPAGDGSIYARLWLVTIVDPIPVAGDEIARSSTVYLVVQVEADSAGGIWLLLRKDRDVP